MSIQIKRQTVLKYYSPKDSLFHILEKGNDSWTYKERTYKTFLGFYNACNHDISGADLVDYYFKEKDNIKKINFDGAKINSDTMKLLNIYDGKQFRAIKKWKDKASITPSTSENLLPERADCWDIQNIENVDDNDALVFYISDLHLNHKILQKYKKQVNEFEIDDYLKKVVHSLYKSVKNHGHVFCILFVGDVSFDFDIFERFFKIYCQTFVRFDTFFVLGNHELWDERIYKECHSYDEVVKKYRKLLKTLNIELLEADLILLRPSFISFIKNRVSVKELLKLSEDEIRRLFKTNCAAIFGGMGFSGLNEQLNCNHGIYRSQVIDRDLEIKRSKLMNSLHVKLRKAVPNKKIIVATHMPFEDWCSDDICSNWIYVSGHTHKNTYRMSNELTRFADNQIGYTNDSFGFKSFPISGIVNLFDDLPDGFHEITKDDYYFFNCYIGINSTINRDVYKMFLVKKNNHYMFFAKLKEDGDLYILNGGHILKVNGKPLDYFYNHMQQYVDSIKEFLKDYLAYQKSVAQQVKLFGGSGKIHGAIVDINFFSHLFINPFDRTITPYYAESMSSKHVYKNVGSLLKYRNPEIFEEYSQIDQSLNLPSLVTNSNKLSKESIFVSDTNMYRVSRVIKSLQYTTTLNVIRIWNFDIADNVTPKTGERLVLDIVNQIQTKKE